MSSTPLVIAAVTLLTPLIVRRLARAFPPRQLPSSQDYEWLRTRHRSTELWSQVLSMSGGVVGVFFILQIHRNIFWLVGTMFGWLIIPPVVFIALRTLPEGFSCWREFWCFYELEYQTSLQLIVPIYALLALIGMVFDSRLANWLGSDESENNSEA